eukprot:2957340-Amphidinium_carterae.1
MAMPVALTDHLDRSKKQLLRGRTGSVPMDFGREMPHNPMWCGSSSMPLAPGPCRVPASQISTPLYLRRRAGSWMRGGKRRRCCRSTGHNSHSGGAKYGGIHTFSPPVCNRNNPSRCILHTTYVGRKFSV